MIKISRLALSDRGAWTRLCADIDCDGVKTALWFEVENRFASYLCPERSDAFVLALLQWAMKYGHDIECETPMTDRLYVSLVGQFLPAFYRANGFERNKDKLGDGCGYPVQITAQTAPEVERIGQGAIGTGVSTGVDSLHVFAMHPEITHACLWTGIGANGGEEGERRSRAWEESIRHSAEFCDYVKIPLIVGRTNFFDSGCLPGLQWSYYTTFGNLFCIFALQKLWKTYYIASDCGIEHFNFRISLEEDPAHYEFFLFPNVALNHMTIFMDGADCTRVDKVRDLVKYEPAHKYLNTCWLWDKQSLHRNCSCHCPKCMRTMLSLYGFDALDEFRTVYDVDYFKKHFDQYVAEYYRGCIQKDFFITELRPYMKTKRIPLGVKLSALRIVLKKAVKKVLRLGNRSYTFSPEG